MLDFVRGGGARFCDGVSRREFLRAGGLTMGGLSLAQLGAIETAAAQRPGQKSVIMIFLCGGPPHQDMFDLKPDQPAEIRGEFKPIPTNVDGVQICELMPRLAKMMDRCTIIRSLVGARDEHASHLCYSGYTTFEYRQGKWPSLGSSVSYLQGPVAPTVPPFVSLSHKMSFAGWMDPGQAGFLGLPYQPFLPTHGSVAEDMKLATIDAGRLAGRRRLLEKMDGLRRDSEPLLVGADAATRNALDLLSSNRVAQALDLSREDPKTVESYGPSSLVNVDDGGPMWNHGLLMSRRLVEAGVRVVSLGYGRWDYHGANFKQCRDRLPLLDQGVAALISDLHDRGMDRDVSVIVWGDFGRTPRINADAGRDHWAPVSCALLAGGGMRHGQVIGSTTPDAGYADERPVHYKDVMATLYHNLGIDLERTTVPGQDGRPMHLLQGHSPVRELVG